MLRNLLPIIVFSLVVSICYSQEKWSLEKCVNYAEQNSLTVKQAQFDIGRSSLNLKQGQMNRLPNVSASANGGYSFGLNVDPRTNDLVQQQIGFNNISANVSMSLYNGNQINNSIKQSKIDIEAAKLNAQAAVDNIGLSIASAYLDILLAEEQVENAKKRLELSESQLAQTDKLIEAGSLPYNDRLDIVAQMALDQQGIIEAENLVVINYLNLKQLMQIDPKQDIVIDRPAIPEIQMANPDNFLLEKTYSAALGNLAFVEANEMQLRSFELGENIAKASLLPRLSLFVNLDSRFASLVDSPIPNDGYFTQLNENFGQVVGLSLNIPVFDNYRGRIGIERARINTLNQQVINQQQQQDLKTNIQRAIADARASQKRLAAAETSLEAAQAAFENSEKRFELGAINTFEFTQARNRLDQAQVELTRAKYQYVFNLKVVEFYEGKPLQLK